MGRGCPQGWEQAPPVHLLPPGRRLTVQGGGISAAMLFPSRLIPQLINLNRLCHHPLRPPAPGG